MNPVKNNLVALGSAAVLTVYAAGYLRTREAADRFAGEDNDRRRAVATSEHTPGPDSSVTDTDRMLAAQPASIDSTIHDLAPKTAAPSSSTARQVKDAATPPPHSDVTLAQPAPANAASTTSVATAKIADSTLAPHVVALAPAAPAPTAGLQGGSGALVGDTTTQPSQNAHRQWKDGTYSGWGTSRHGDIEATVEVREGRIVSAAISQCRTRYSCSWISHLPGQVVSRQSPEVDYVSGATQSTNAFYYAVVEALSKAK